MSTKFTFPKGFNVHLYDVLLVGFTRVFCIPSSLLSNPAKGGYQNHKSVSDNPSAVRDKLVTERGFGSIACPFSLYPFNNLVLSPLTIVTKRGPGEFRLLHDFSFPKHNSVKSHMPRDFTTVQFELLDKCIERTLDIGVGRHVAKADFKDAFRIIPFWPLDYHLLGFTFQSRLYFLTCVSLWDAESLVKHLRRCRLSFSGFVSTCSEFPCSMCHILDDFIFFGPPRSGQCRFNIDAFFTLCRSLSLPVKHAKTVLPTSAHTLNGVLVHTCAQSLTLLTDKLTTLIQRLHLLSQR